MNPWIECVPNFSEGRDVAVIQALRETLGAVRGAHVLDVHADESHHRSVYTCVGEPEAVAEAVFRAVRLAVERIDLTRHTGEHPRMGAADVVPFVPLGDATLDVCVAMAERVGERIGRELQVPVYLYGHAAREGHSVELPIIRRGGFEALRDALPNDTARTPDYGPNAVHATAGATAVGARSFLIAFNVFLDTSDVRTADRVARQVRTSNGGLPCVQAKGFLVAGQAQVSMNLLDIDVVDPQKAFDVVARLARECGTNVIKSEFVGLVPEQAVSKSTEASLRLASRLDDHLLEPKVQHAAAGDDRLGS